MLKEKIKMSLLLPLILICQLKFDQMEWKKATKKWKDSFSKRSVFTNITLHDVIVKKKTFKFIKGNR